MMPRFIVTGNVICGAFTHVVEAKDEDEAVEIVNQLSTDELDTVSSEHEFPLAEVAVVEEQVVCSACRHLCASEKAHLHQGEWIGDECCWDERLRASE
jgi:hypothetical protein